ncbi:hypothetical protein [Pedobacter duraquae]|uniref:Uncharacterized protein n=1 Tax=Pedobacter duraquae TaxID=425511 RepID=A0A4V3C3X4_9SPHI|nr:hypothetical protein [Pedobacter duraquae]TDO23748.1 hypothetical protein CLV32_0033 [Pedobacter duraquae]
MERNLLETIISSEYLLEHVELQDISDAIVMIQQSFQISFHENELADVKIFEDLCNLIHGKINLEHNDDCTSQQAYYKLNRALSDVFNLSKLHLSPETLIEDIIPRKNRIEKVKMLEDILDMRLFLLSPPFWLTCMLIVIFLLSLLAFFIGWKIAISGIAFSLLGFRIADRMGKEIAIKTVGELTDNMVSNNYIKSRRDPNTVNKRELDDVTRSIFIKLFYLSPSALHKEAKFSEY